jgi:O-antigen/teichoic acid export membrane protein
MGITIFISLYSTRLILNALGVADYGIFNVVGGAIAMLTFLNTAMTTSSQRFMSFAQGQGEKEKQKEIFNVSVVLHTAIGIIVFILLQLAGIVLFKKILTIDPERIHAAKMVYQFLIISTLFTIISVPYDAVLNAHENMMLVGVLGILESLMKLSIALFITFTSNDRLITYGMLMAFMYISLLIIRRIYCHKKYPEVTIDIKKYFNVSLFKEMSSFAGWSFLGSSVSMITNYGQGLLLNIFFGVKINAAQGVSNQISGQLGSFSGNLLKALNPVIVKSEGAGQREKMLRASITGSKISFYLLAFFSIPVMVEMPIIFNFWLKEVPEFAIVFCRLLLIRNLITQLFLPLVTAIGATGNIKNYQIGDSILTMLPLPISYIFFKMGYGPTTLYLAFIVLVLIRSFGVVLYQAKIQCRLNVRLYLYDVVLKCMIVVLVSLLFALGPYYLMNDSGVRVMAVFVMFFSTFTLIVYNFGLTQEERKKVLTLFKGLISKVYKS